MRIIACIVCIFALSLEARAVDLGDLLQKLQGEPAQQAAPAPSAQGLAALSESDMVKGLRQALDQGAAAAVAKLGKKDGFLGNDQVKIPLPPSVEKVAGVMRAVGQGAVADDLVVTMNRAAEAAVPQAKTLLLGAIKKMSVQDAKAILTGGDDAATQYFRKTTESQLHDSFLPIVTKSVSKLGVTQRYNSLAGKAAQFGLVEPEQASIQEYVTDKSLDGLFLMVAEEERAIRKNPVERTGYWVKKVFGALGE